MVLENGFEEIEAIIPADILRRIGVEVYLASSSNPVPGSHGIEIVPDTDIDTALANHFDCLILPGGIPGSTNLRDNPKVIELIVKIFSEGGIVAAICAAPIALARAGILKGKKATCYPSFKSELGGGVLYTAASVETSGNIITARGAGTSFEFTAKIAEMLGLSEKLVQTYSNMFVK